MKKPITCDPQELTAREIASVHRQTFIREEYPQHTKTLCGAILWLSIFVSTVYAIYLTIHPGSRLLLGYPFIILCMVFAGYYDAYRSMSAYKKFRQLYPEEYELLTTRSNN